MLSDLVTVPRLLLKSSRSPGSRLAKSFAIASRNGWVKAVHCSSAHLHADGRTRETERLAQAVLQKPLAGKVEFGGDVGEEDERRRGDASLRRVEDANLAPTRTGRGMDGGHGGNEPVQLRALLFLSCYHVWLWSFIDLAEQNTIPAGTQTLSR